jgi:hypothetical protein
LVLTLAYYAKEIASSKKEKFKEIPELIQYFYHIVGIINIEVKIDIIDYDTYGCGLVHRLLTGLWCKRT